MSHSSADTPPLVRLAKLSLGLVKGDRYVAAAIEMPERSASLAMAFEKSNKTMSWGAATVSSTRDSSKAIQTPP
ncbi:MAG: hypothetical protein KC561_14030, partial [Myxococcales bacterium]|nr:hypothetical protein [Myxococcales bacterium]